MPGSSGSLESLRALNRLRVVDALRRHGTLSRADISRATGLSRSTVSTLVADLHRLGFVTAGAGNEASDGPAPVGRPPLMLRLDAPAGITVGLDFDHTRVRVAVSDLSRNVLTERAVELDVDGDAPRALETAASLIGHALADAGVDAAHLLGVGVAMAGPVDPARRRLHDSPILVDWTGVDAAAELRDRLGVPVHIENDANLGALAEATVGAARSARTAIYVQLSSGVGAGLIVEGQLFRGSAGVAGEIGHFIVDEGGLPCRCGRRGCLETLVSGPAIVRQVSEQRHEPLSLDQTIALAGAGDAVCAAAIERAGRIVGRVVGEACNLLNPEMVVVGGELSAAGDLLLEPLGSALRETALPASTRDLEVVSGELGDTANLLGAVALAIARSEETLTEHIARSHSR